MNPLINAMVAECETTSEKVRTKLRDPFGWCYCDICGQSTEYATALMARKVFKRKAPEAKIAELLDFSDSMRDEAQRIADKLVERFEKALEGGSGPHEAGQMLVAYCDMKEVQDAWHTRERTELVEAFRSQVEQRARHTVWSLHGDSLGAALLPNQKDGDAKPSKFYCEKHNPSRSVEARRAYQRDRRFSAEYEELMSMMWGTGKFATWDIQAHEHVRQEAYRLLHIMKSTKDLIKAELSKGIQNQAEIARNLGIEHRQTVSIAMKRHQLKSAR